MNTWILVVVMAAPNVTSTVAMQEFNTAQACQYAAGQISNVSPYIRKLECVPKGEIK